MMAFQLQDMQQYLALLKALTTTSATTTIFKQPRTYPMTTPCKTFEILNQEEKTLPHHLIKKTSTDDIHLISHGSV
ncbi:hypothetical protein DPMN_117682 [Dreissena polymorpha]|uniref:Uncharacterized protein n=1 Tax=Dreissena polymorpha TaxID=45954 RepID=A0A9D4GG59_DREPO|nr:hypothetical protein DPMN_117682 [Dreissena polymorpha]